MLPRISPRLGIFLFFAMLAVLTPLVIGGALWFAHGRLMETGPDQMAGILFLAGGGAAFVLAAVITGVWVLFDRDVALPIQGLVRDLQTLTHGNPTHRIETESLKRLGELPEAAQAVAENLNAAMGDTGRKVADATRAMEEQKARLEAVLNDLHAGVIICNLNHQILLYNQYALRLLHVSGELGLGRPLFSVMNRQPFFHALERLTNRFVEGRHEGHPDDLTAGFVCATTDGRYTLEGRMGLVMDGDGDGKLSGYVVTLTDFTEELAVLGKRDRLLRLATEGLRYPVANLRAAAETLAEYPGMERDQRAAFEAVIFEEANNLSAVLEDLAGQYREIVTGHWPTADVYSANLLNCVVRRLREERHIGAVMTGLPQWLHGDSHTLVELLDCLVHKVHEQTGVAAVDLEAGRSGERVYLDVIWEGPAIPSGVLEEWFDTPLEEGLGGLTVRDVLEHHRGELWSQSHKEGSARLRLPVPSALASDTADTPGVVLPARPEFYDFDLLARPALAGGMGETPLCELTYVVFDTETTGLRPSSGDEIISLAGVRIVNGRILTGESFSQTVKPGRAIPRSSIRFHGITDEMVADRPPIEIVLPQFHNYVGGAVLVAHNAAFDMKFVKLLEEECGVAFDNPVLDTLLLSAYLHDHTNQHSLDDCAARFGIEIQGRHTALGDSLVTADVFLRMIELLELRGIQTLNAALDAANSIVEVRKMQERF